MKVSMLAAISLATAATTLPLAQTAHADSTEFQTPSGNIECWMHSGDSGCDIGDYTFAPPTTPITPSCSGGTSVIRFDVAQGHPSAAACHPAGPFSDLHAAGLATLDYGQTRSVGAFTCDSELSGMTCTDTSTGHFFRVSRDSYQLG
jgi:hypothetical protein